MKDKEMHYFSNLFHKVLYQVNSRNSASLYQNLRNSTSLYQNSRNSASLYNESRRDALFLKFYLINLFIK